MSRDDSTIGLMHITDSLAAGGLERVAVNLANLMPRSQYQTHLCTTRCEGPLSELVAEDVGRLQLNRKRRFEKQAIDRLVDYVREHRIEILHAHGSALLIARTAAMFKPHPQVYWHDHFGRYAVEERPAWIYRLLTRGVAGVFAVNEPLACWSRDRLRVPADRVWYLPNFACETPPTELPDELPGVAGYRIVCVANLRPEKDHLTLLDAMATVVSKVPQAHLLIVGAVNDAEYESKIKQKIRQCALGQHVSLLGPRRDIPAVMRACDIGVLSSMSEGLPLSLLEYGLAGLPTVATRVGQCPEVLLDGACGLLVSCGCPQEMSAALQQLLESEPRRAELSQAFQQRLQSNFSAQAAIDRVSEVYQANRRERT